MEACQYRELLAEIDRLRSIVEDMARREKERTSPPSPPEQPTNVGMSSGEKDSSRPQRGDQADGKTPPTATGEKRHETEHSRPTRASAPKEGEKPSAAPEGRAQHGPRHGPPEDVAEVLETIQRLMTDPSARESGYTLLFALLETRGGRERQSMLACVSESDVGKVLVPDLELVRFAAAFTSPWRLKIIRALAHGSRTSREITAETSLVGGQLYHHLNELIRAGFVRQEARNCYSLTEEVGKPAYLGINLLARTCAHGQARLTRRRETCGAEPEESCGSGDPAEYSEA